LSLPLESGLKILIIASAHMGQSLHPTSERDWLVQA
jgi:hypothetical protein